MNVHEYQAKEILAQFGIPVPAGKVAFTPAEAEAVARELGSAKFVVKAQIHAGGRGKGGGVKLANTPEEVRAIAEKMIGMQLVTHQTGPDGKKVEKVLIAEAVEIKQELYLGFVLDRAKSAVTMMASAEGGVEIETVAEERPEAILRETADPSVGLMPFQATRAAFGLGLDDTLIRQFTSMATKMYECFVKTDASIIEINPLAVVGDNQLVALDAKMNFDDNGLFRHKDIAAMLDPTEEDERELEANENLLSYVSLDGNIGCMVNGAGLAMSTMDIIKYYGAFPANFLDVGGRATAERVTLAFKLILSDPNVKAILVNIFGGIVNCDLIAAGIIEAVKQVELNVPLVVRLEGTNVEKGRQMLAASDIEIISAESLDEAAQKAVAAVRG
ncbi:MAG: ADP-forming succinate--CoA ligase subunit beta [Candidatus Poribacteria bacterium]|nr:ADP-forming succinate--CoA ligase subunit beta [Candidatus Poribacteria bacterium]